MVLTKYRCTWLSHHLAMNLFYSRTDAVLVLIHLFNTKTSFIRSIVFKNISRGARLFTGFLLKVGRWFLKGLRRLRSLLFLFVFLLSFSNVIHHCLMSFLLIFSLLQLLFLLFSCHLSLWRWRCNNLIRWDWFYFNLLNSIVIQLKHIVVILLWCLWLLYLLSIY